MDGRRGPAGPGIRWASCCGGGVPAGRTIESFGARLHQQVDLDGLTGELLAVVDQTVQPTRAWVWLRP